MNHDPAKETFFFFDEKVRIAYDILEKDSRKGGAARTGHRQGEDLWQAK